MFLILACFFLCCFEQKHLETWEDKPPWELLPVSDIPAAQRPRLRPGAPSPHTGKPSKVTNLQNSPEYTYVKLLGHGD